VLQDSAQSTAINDRESIFNDAVLSCGRVRLLFSPGVQRMRYWVWQAMLVRTWCTASSSK